MESITVEQIGNMKHAIGFDQRRVKRGKYEAYRNYYTTPAPHAGWEELVEKGYAEKHPFPQGVGENPMMYRVTQKGIETLGGILGIKIVDTD